MEEKLEKAIGELVKYATQGTDRIQERIQTSFMEIELYTQLLAMNEGLITNNPTGAVSTFVNPSILRMSPEQKIAYKKRLVEDIKSGTIPGIAYDRKDLDFETIVSSFTNKYNKKDIPKKDIKSFENIETTLTLQGIKDNDIYRTNLGEFQKHNEESVYSSRKITGYPICPEFKERQKPTSFQILRDSITQEGSIINQRLIEMDQLRSRVETRYKSAVRKVAQLYK